MPLWSGRCKGFRGGYLVRLCVGIAFNIQAHSDSSRWKLSRQLCEAMGWKQPNGALRDVVCRGLLLMLERAGQIQLPPVRCHIRGQSRRERSRPPTFRIDTTPLAMPLKTLGPIDVQLAGGRSGVEFGAASLG
jgi:hypothetical protein